MIETRPARVFLVDDHPIVRDGFRMLLESEESFTVVGEADSGEEALDQLSERGAHLAVVDISMEGMDGIELTRELTGNGREGSDLSDPLILIVSMHGETHYVESALEAGARGYVLKENVHALLLEAIREILAGDVYLDPDLRGNV